MGDPAEIKAKRVKKQKFDREDARLLLRLMRENTFRKSGYQVRRIGITATVVASSSHGTDAHTDHESVAGVGHERGLSLEKKLFSEQGRAS